VGTDSRLNVWRGRKKYRKNLIAKYMFSYFRSFLKNTSMEKAKMKAMEICEQVEDADS